MSLIRNRILILMAMIFLLAGIFLTIDTISLQENMALQVSFIAKFICTFLITLIAFLIPKENAINDSDREMIRGIFISLLISDFFMVLLQAFLPQEDKGTVIGIGIGGYLIVQSLLILRHSNGYHLEVPSKTSTGKKRELFKVITGLLFFAPAIWITVYFHPIVKSYLLSFVVGAFSILLTTSTWMGIAVINRTTFGTPNKYYIGISTSLLLISGIALGLNTVGPDYMHSTTRLLIFLFYVPGLLLLAFSGFKVNPLSVTKLSEKFPNSERGYSEPSAYQTKIPVEEM